MPNNQGLGIVLLEASQQLHQGDLLGSCTGVVMLAIAIYASFQTDANGMFVMMKAVGANHFNWATFLYCAIKLNIEVIADVFVTTVLDVVIPAGFSRVTTVFSRSTAVQDNKGDFSHKIVFIVNGIVLSLSDSRERKEPKRETADCIFSTKNHSRFPKTQKLASLKQFAFLYGKLSRFS